MPTIEYSCTDGTPFPVTFATDEDAQLSWHLEQEHCIGPGTPLAVELDWLGRPGAARAYAEAEVPFPSAWRNGPDANGFAYYLDSFPGPDEMAATVAACARLVQEYGSALGIWRDFSLPRVRAACTWLQGADADVPLAELSAQQAYAIHHTMVSSMVTWNDMQLVTAVLQDLFGAEAELLAAELSQGYESATLNGDQRLWEIARLAAADESVTTALAADDPSSAMARLRNEGTAAAFFSSLDDFLAEYGDRAETWTVDSPTWAEQANGLWAQIRRLTSDGVASPDEAVRAGAGRRTELLASIEARLPDEAVRARLRRRVDRLSCYVPVREERAHWQLVSVGALRHAVLRRGRVLSDRGVVRDPADVFFLTVDEAEAATRSDDLSAVVAERRAEHERWRAASPPLVVGGSGPNVAESAAPSTVLRGVGASRGSATGTARVILDLADACRVDDGDVLVCRMTGPPWTSLFAVAAAVVADTGGMTSHPAIAAREYGIPCVVGTGRATQLIDDGAKVRVDGTAGTVELL